MSKFEGQGPARRRMAARCTATLGASCVLAALSGPVFAQSTEARDVADGDIIVTGSRIATRRFDSPAPVATYDSKAIETSGAVSLGDTLSRLPQMGSSATAGVNGNNAESTGTVNLDLRRLGTNRTLVLINGRRQVGAVSGTAAVDVNTIPSALIDRVEILTGGASAVYGADAVTGVVNFVLKDKYQGLQIDARYGDADEGSTGTVSLSGLAGFSFGEKRGNIVVSAEYSRNSGLDASDRSFRRASIFPVGNPEDPFFNDPTKADFLFLPGVRESYYSASGVIHDFEQYNLNGHTGTSTNAYQLAAGGNIVPFNTGTLTDFGGNSVGGDGQLAGPLYGNTFLPQVERMIVNINSSYDFSDKITGFVEAKFARVASSASQAYYFSDLTLFPDNAFLSDQGRALLSSFGADSVTVNRDNTDIGRPVFDSKRSTYRIVGGLKGDLNEHLRFETTLTYSKVDNAVTTRGDVIPARLQAASDAVVSGGQVVCRVLQQQAAGITPTLPDGSAAPDYAVNGCVPFNIFGEGSFSAAAKRWVTADYTSVSSQNQIVGNLTFSGDTGAFFVLPGGPVAFAVGAEYRREAASSTPAGIVSLGIFGTTASALKGDYDAKEIYAELKVPILSRVPFAEELSLNGAFRLSDYSTIGTTKTWNVGGVWAPISDVRFRGSISQAVRAPNIGELFGAQSIGSGFVTDPCGVSQISAGSSTRRANCQALGVPASGLVGPFSNFPIVTGGNPNLSPEKSRSYTAGVVLRPSFVPGLQFSADFWSYKITNAITAIGLQSAADRCVDAPVLEPTICSLITRDPTTHLITGISASQANIAALKARGFDFDLNYVYRASFGTLRVGTTATYTTSLRVYPFQNFPDQSDDYSGFLRSPGLPKFQGALTLGGTFGKFDLTYRARGVSSAYFDTPTNVARNPDRYAPNKSGFYSTHDVNVQYDLSEFIQIYGGVNNIFQKYPAFGNTGASASSAIYDNIGRYYYGGVRYKL